MRLDRWVALFALASGIFNFSIAQAPLVPSDADSHITFIIKNFGVTVDGSFSGLQGEIIFDPAIPGDSHFDITVDANTIDTGIGLRDNHLKKEEYLNVKQFPQIRFESKKVAPTAKLNTFVMTGNLSIKNISREISFPFTYSIGGIFNGEFQINRRDYDVGGNSISLSDYLTVHLNVKAIE
ncbi:MAG TPA: YceI family protein [Cyclobacteriaceae bacterium]|nr:YceI family protein [Cyclobacteriaceae bacterium]